MAKMNKRDVAIERETMVEEIEEWFGNIQDGSGTQEPPLWAWWPISDAGLEVSVIAEFMNGASDELGNEIVEQVLNASDDQIRNYAEARLAWIERI